MSADSVGRSREKVDDEPELIGGESFFVEPVEWDENIYRLQQKEIIGVGKFQRTYKTLAGYILVFPSCSEQSLRSAVIRYYKGMPVREARFVEFRGHWAFRLGKTSVASQGIIEMRREIDQLIEEQEQQICVEATEPMARGFGGRIRKFFGL